jgi:hypothetical protein
MTRVLLSFLVLAVLVLAVWGMYRGWQHRGRRQSAALGEFPVPPTDPGSVVLGPATGLYVGSAIAGNWQDRVAVGDIGHRASATLTLHADGVLLSRHGATSIWIPQASIDSARTDYRLAGKVMTKDGLLVLRWQVGEEMVDTGFRADDKSAYPDWVRAVSAHAGASTADKKDGDSA